MSLPGLRRHISSIDFEDRPWSGSWHEISIAFNLDHVEGFLDNILPLLRCFDLGYFKLLRKHVRRWGAWWLLRWWASHIKPLGRSALLLTLHHCVILYDSPQSRLITRHFKASLLVGSTSTLVGVVSAVGYHTHLLEACNWILGSHLALSQGLVGNYVYIDRFTPTHVASWTVTIVAINDKGGVIVDIECCSI